MAGENITDREILEWIASQNKFEIAPKTYTSRQSEPLFSIEFETTDGYECIAYGATLEEAITNAINWDFEWFDDGYWLHASDGFKETGKVK